MSDPLSATAVCPHGHTSVDRAVCSVCGTPIAGSVLSGSDSTPTVGATAAHNAAYTSMLPRASASSGTCPHCSAPLDDGSRFCEVCGYDPMTGSLPEAPVVQPAAPAPVAPPAAVAPAAPMSPSLAAPSAATGLVAVITADRAYFESHHVGDVQFPVGIPPRVIELPAGQVTIGRRSRSRGTNPDIDLAGPPEDPAVSHTHASLLPTPEGWDLVDHGSTNGTHLNESLEPLPPNRLVAVKAGDRIYVGAWTRISLELRAPR
jgi:hypothetical protein